MCEVLLVLLVFESANFFQLIRYYAVFLVIVTAGDEIEIEVGIQTETETDAKEEGTVMKMMIEAKVRKNFSDWDCVKTYLISYRRTDSFGRKNVGGNTNFYNLRRKNVDNTQSAISSYESK